LHSDSQTLLFALGHSSPLIRTSYWTQTILLVSVRILHFVFHVSSFLCIHVNGFPAIVNHLNKCIELLVNYVILLYITLCTIIT